MPLSKKLILTSMVLLVYALHQDFWNWKKYEPLLFGFLPAGLTYHIGYSIAASLMMAVLVRFAWPKHLEKVAPEKEKGGAK